MLLLVLVATLGWLPAICNAHLSPAARQEIDALLHAVGTSGCEFLRGATVHSAMQAQAHLQQKYDYLDVRGQLNSAEDFIAKAATRSSMTGQVYGIRCVGAAPQASAEWLKTRLKALRLPAASGHPKAQVRRPIATTLARTAAAASV